LWTEEALANKPRNFTVPPASHCIFVDASKYGWGAVVWDTDANEVTTLSKRWDTKTRSRGVERSTTAEPIGLTRAVKQAIGEDRKTTVHVYTDSITAKCAHTCGYAADYTINATVQALRRALPSVKLCIRHVPGKLNPADGLSRGRSDDSWSVGELTGLVNGLMGDDLPDLPCPNDSCANSPGASTKGHLG
jgi:hypothetical protein